MKKFLFLFALTLSCVLLNQAKAQTTTKKATTRQVKQVVRIADGQQSGELTRREARQLKRQQRKINSAKKMAKADGTVTKREKRTLNRMQNKANRNIRRKKHNQRSRIDD